MPKVEEDFVHPEYPSTRKLPPRDTLAPKLRLARARVTRCMVYKGHHAVVYTTGIGGQSSVLGFFSN